jgi:hypothetical protein
VPPDAADLDGDGDSAESLPLDLAGLPRFADDSGTPDTGEGLSPMVDLGAYEFQGTSPTRTPTATPTPTAVATATATATARVPPSSTATPTATAGPQSVSQSSGGGRLGLVLCLLASGVAWLPGADRRFRGRRPARSPRPVTP